MKIYGHRNSGLWCAGCLVLLALGATEQAAAYTTYDWNGGSDLSWVTTGNWSPAPTFDLNAEARFANSNNLPTGTALTLDGDTVIGRLTVTNSTSINGYTLSIGPGSPSASTLTMNDLFEAFNTANGYQSALNLNSPVVLGSGGGTWTISGQVSGGADITKCIFNAAVTNSGGLLTIKGSGASAGIFIFNTNAVLPALTLAGKADTRYNGRTLVNGNLAVTGSQAATFNGDDNQIAGILFNTYSGGSVTFNGARTTFLGAVSNLMSSFTITLNGGQNTFLGPVTISAGGGGTIYFNGASNTFAGAINLLGGGVGVGGQDALGSATLGYVGGNTLSLTGIHTISNTINYSGTQALTVKPNAGVVTYSGALTGFSAGRTLTVSGTDGVLIFSPASGLNNNTNLVTGGTISSASTGLPGPLTINGGSVLVDGMSWPDWNAARPYGSGNGQWQFLSGGFAARGTNAFVIDSVPAGMSLNNTLKRLGSIAKDGAGAHYANAPVEIAVDMVMTSRQTVAVSETGPGFTRFPTSGVIHTISGNITGAGVPTFAFQAGQSDRETAEVILSGSSNVWNGSVYVAGGGGSGMNSGQGGMLANRALVRFPSPAALPKGGTPGAQRFLVANGVGGGYLLDGSPGGTIYDLGTTRSGYRFVIFSTVMGTVLGADGGVVTLQNSIVQMHNANNSDGSAGATLLVRKGSVFNLGSLDAPLMWARSFKTAAETDAGLTGGPTVPTQGASVRNIYKRGEGTVVLRNIQFKLIDGTTDDSVSTAWQIGRGTVGNMGTNAYFDGVVRETGSGNSNSCVNRITFAGGVVESSGTITRSLNNTAGTIDWGGGGGGGFAAFGGNLDVTITGFSAGNVTNSPAIWGSSARFIAANDAMIFGSYSADARVDFKTSLRLDTAANSTTGTREIRILDNANSTADVARFSGAILGTANTTLSKAGDGVLELTSITNLYAGPTAINAGTLLVNGSLNPGGGTVTVASGAALGGTGTISRAVVVSTNGAITAGAQASGDPGTLTVNGNVSLADNARVLVDINSTTNDKVQVNGTLTLPAAATVSVSTLGDPGNLRARVLFSATALAGSTGELTQWVLSDSARGRIVTQGNNVVWLPPASGSLILVR